MSRQARVTSLDALLQIRAALLKFEHAARDAVESLRLESRRGADWVAERARYWPAQARKADDALKSARIDLERCEMALRAEDKRSCYDQKKAVEQAKRRLRLCEEKVRVVRHWAREASQEAIDFAGDLARLEHYLGSDVPRAVALLENMHGALERYAGSGNGPATPPAPAAEPDDTE